MTRTFLITLLSCLDLARLLHAAPGDVDPAFDPGSGVIGAPICVAVQADGKIIIGGDFIRVRGAFRNRIARLNADGTADKTFDPGTGADSSVISVAVQTDGKVLLGGNFTTINGANQNHFARLNTDGSLDDTFNSGTGANGQVRSVILQTDGKVLLGGEFSTINWTSRSGIARLNTDGSLDSTFYPGTGANGRVECITVQLDGKVLVGGGFTSFNGASRNRIARLNSDGSLDSSFSYDVFWRLGDSVHSIAVQTDGKVLVGGGGLSLAATFVRLNADGRQESTFNPSVIGDILSIALQTDGKILVGGFFSMFNGSPRLKIARLNTSGNLDPLFNPGAALSYSVQSIAIQTDGRVLVSDNQGNFGIPTGNQLARFNPNGSLDSSFNANLGLDNTVYSLAGQPDGKVIAGGAFTNVNRTSRNAIARLNADGSLDSAFNPGTGANGNVQSVALQTDGKVVLGGAFTSMNGMNRNRIARLNANGSLDSTFDPGTGANIDVISVVMQTDGKVLLGGVFTSVNGTNRNRIARLNTNGSLDSTFDPGNALNGVVRSIALQTDGKVLFGGDFNTFDGSTRNRIMRLNSDGSLDSTFNPGSGADGTVFFVVLQKDGKIMIGGVFNTINGTNRKGVARLNSDGSLDNAFNPTLGANSLIRSIAVQTDGKVLLGGAFTFTNATNPNFVARLNIDGSSDRSFRPCKGAGENSPSVFAVALQADGNVLIGGNFLTINGEFRPYVAQLLGDSISALPIPLNVQYAGNQVVLNWSNPAFSLQSASFVTGAYSNVLGATSPYTNSITGSQQYFRLKAN